MRRKVIWAACGALGVGVVAAASVVAYATVQCSEHKHPAISGDVRCQSTAEAIQLASIVEVTARANNTTAQSISLDDETLRYSVDFVGDPVLPICFETTRVTDQSASDLRSGAAIILVNLFLMLLVAIAVGRYYDRPEAAITPPDEAEGLPRG